jgi:hypothetical protein
VNQGHNYKHSTLSKGLLAKWIFPLLCALTGSCKNPYRIVERSKKCKPNFVVLCVTRTTFSTKHVYTFELQFLLEKLKCKIPRSVILQNPYMILSWILDML